MMPLQPERLVVLIDGKRASNLVHATREAAQTEQGKLIQRLQENSAGSQPGAHVPNVTISNLLMG